DRYCAAPGARSPHAGLHARRWPAPAPVTLEQVRAHRRAVPCPCLHRKRAVGCKSTGEIHRPRDDGAGSRRYDDPASEGRCVMGNRHEMAEEPASSAVRQQLRRMLAQAPFDRSPVPSRFLAHVVEHALVEAARPLKEYTLGVEVFDRPDDFDPRVDTIVRVQARRLRSALARYYGDCGSNDSVRFEMPKGQYGIRASWIRRGQAQEGGHEDGPGSGQASPAGAAVDAAL